MYSLSTACPQSPGSLRSVCTAVSRSGGGVFSPCVFQDSDITDEEQKEEVFWWHACWLSTTKQLNQWNSLNEFAKAIGPETSLALDCASKLQHWDLLDHLVDTFGIHSPYTKLCQASLQSSRTGFLSGHYLLLIRRRPNKDRRWWFFSLVGICSP